MDTIQTAGSKSPGSKPSREAEFFRTSLVINTFVVAVFAKGFFGDPDTADIGLANAGKFLGDAFGQTMTLGKAPLFLD